MLTIGEEYQLRYWMASVVVDINLLETAPTKWVRWIRYHGYWRLPSFKMQEYQDRCDLILAERLLYE